MAAEQVRLKFLAIAALAIAALLFGAQSASALQTHNQGDDLKVEEIAAKRHYGIGCCLAGLGVDPASGDVYVADQYGPNFEAPTVHRFKADGSYDDSFNLVEETEHPGPEPGDPPTYTFSSKLGLSEPLDVAVDDSGTASDGNVYIAEGSGRITVIDSSGAPLSTVSGALRPCGLAMDQATGNLFVADQSTNHVLIFDNTGALEGEVEDSALQGPCGIALSPSAESLYVRNANDGRVIRLQRKSTFAYGSASVLYAPNYEAGEGNANDVAVDSTTNHLYIDLGDRIRELDEFGGPVNTFGQPALCCSSAIAIDGSGGKVYATNGSSILSFSTALVTVPDATTGAATNVTGDSATLNGTINAAEASPATCEFQYDTSGSYESPSTAPCSPAGPFTGGGDEAVSADLTGLTPGTTYHYRLKATNGEGSSFGADATFTTHGAPLVNSFFAGKVTAAGAVLHATIDPRGASTTYRFEYTTAADFAEHGFASATKAPDPDGSLASTGSPQSVEETISGLSPATEYAFRVLATNEVDATESAEKHFTTFAASEPPTQGVFPGQGFLPDDRAWELVTPPQKNGSDVIASSPKLRAAADGSAFEYGSLGGFSDLRGFGVDTEYISQRTAAPGTSGWATHGITPPQQTLTFNADVLGYQPFYDGEFSPDLDRGVFKSFSALTNAPNIADIPGNLYLRDDLLAPGAGHYQLISDAATELNPLNSYRFQSRPAGASDDFRHLIFESLQPLSPGLVGEARPRLYKYDDGASLPRMVAAGPACPGAQNPTSPCSAGGLGRIAGKYTSHTISNDGSRVEFTAPTAGGGSFKETAGAVSRVFQLDDRGTPDTADDATIQLNASERNTPDFTRFALYQTASTSGDRVFFISDEQLTDSPGGGLYLWQRQDTDEEQEISVDATGGTFTLTAHSQPTRGSGNLESGSNVVTGVDAGSFMTGQTVSGPGIPPNTRIESMSGLDLVLSNPAAADLNGATIDADVEATTAPLPFDSPAKDPNTPGVIDSVQEALGALVQPMNPGEPDLPILGEGNVSVSGGPSDAGTSTPYTLTFTAALAGVNVSQLTADGSGLSGGTPSATVATTHDLRNLTFLTSVGALSAGTIGASEDGHRLYFTVGGSDTIYYWQDVSGPPTGTVSLVGDIPSNDAIWINGFLGHGETRQARVTPDGRHLIFQATDGSRLAPGYDQRSACRTIAVGGCNEVYLYDADTSTPKEPDLVCASCDPSGAAATRGAAINVKFNQGGSASTTGYLTHALSDDGRYVFFTSAERLVPQDTNGLEDAYQYDSVTDEVHLLSSGESPEPSYFADASPDGHDAFILTNERLSRWDTDTNRDLYDARVDGGLPEPLPPPPSCQGDACQPPPSQLIIPTPASLAFNGPDNEGLHPNRCRRGRHRAKTRCPKGGKKHGRRHVKHKRRAGR